MLRAVLASLSSILLLFVASEDAFAGREVIFNPIIEVSNLSISTSKKVVKKSIQRQFDVSEIKEEKENSFRFLFTVRSHSADILVHFSPTLIKLEFLSSENLDYKLKNGNQLIHKNYNVWIRDLEKEIKLELSFAEEDTELAADTDESGAEHVAQSNGTSTALIEGDTKFYIFRQKSMVGAMLTVSVGVNENLVAQLKSSTYVTFTEETGPTEVHILQASSPIASLTVSQRPGETVYLNYDYKRGSLTEITSSRGLELLKKYKPMPILTVYKPNPAYKSG